jgi:hypothetical protein
MKTTSRKRKTTSPSPNVRTLNLYGGPGTGKSTTRSLLFGLMKLGGHKVEDVPEFAKELTWTESWGTLSNQRFVFAEQEHRLRRLKGKVDWVITDSPLPLSIIYGRGEFDDPVWHDEVWRVFDGYDNVNIFLERVKPYAAYGRSETEDEARVLDSRIRRLMGQRIDLFVPGDAKAPARIMNLLGLPAVELA